MDRTDEDRADEPVELVPRMESFTRDFASIPWAYFFQVHAEFEATVAALLHA